MELSLSKTKSCLGMYRKIWTSSHEGSSAYSTQAKYTQIRIEAESGIDRWSIGVSTKNPQLIGKDQEGYRRLRDALEKIGESEAEKAGWVWWQWIDDEYPDLLRSIRATVRPLAAVSSSAFRFVHGIDSSGESGVAGSGSAMLCRRNSATGYAGEREPRSRQALASSQRRWQPRAQP